MTWENAFDVAACTVTVTEVLTVASTTVLFSGVVAKGASTTFQSASFPGSTFTLAVDAAGRIALTVDGSPYLGGFEFDVDVAPAVMTGVVGGRVSGFVQYVDVNGQAVGAQATRSDGAADTQLSSASPGANVTPNPSLLATTPILSIGASLTVGAA